jgi:hypothetical protein
MERQNEMRASVATYNFLNTLPRPASPVSGLRADRLVTWSSDDQSTLILTAP